MMMMRWELAFFFFFFFFFPSRKESTIDFLSLFFCFVIFF